MSLSNSQKSVIYSNMGEISELFNVSEEREFLQKYFSVEDMEKCLKKGQTRQDQAESLCTKMIKRRNKEFFDDLSQYFLKRSDQYKKVHEKMCAGGEMSSREDRVAATVRRGECSQDELRRGDRWTSPRTQSAHLSDNAKGKTLDLISMELTIHVLREKIRQLDQEREFWMRQSADDEPMKILRKEQQDLRDELNKERVETETLTKSYLEYVRKTRKEDRSDSWVIVDSDSNCDSAQQEGGTQVTNRDSDDCVESQHETNSSVGKAIDSFESKGIALEKANSHYESTVEDNESKKKKDSDDINRETLRCSSSDLNITTDTAAEDKTSEIEDKSQFAAQISGDNDEYTKKSDSKSSSPLESDSVNIYQRKSD